MKKYAISTLLCALLLFSGLTFATREEPCDKHSSVAAQSEKQDSERIYIWKDREGVVHIGDEPPKSSGTSSIVSERSAQPQSGESAPEPEQPVPLSSVDVSTHPPPISKAPVQTEQQVVSRLQVQREELEVLFIRARNRGDGYAQIRLRHLLDANSKEQELLRSRIYSFPQDHP